MLFPLLHSNSNRTNPIQSSPVQSSSLLLPDWPLCRLLQIAKVISLADSLFFFLSVFICSQSKLLPCRASGAKEEEKKEAKEGSNLNEVKEATYLNVTIFVIMIV